MARLWAAAVLLSLCALVPASDCLFNPETADELSREPVWNSGAWVVDKLYFSTWAHFQACVSDEAAIATLDELRARVQGEYFPVNNGRSAWDLFQDRQAVAPAAANETVLDLVWPYQRNHLKHARPVRCFLPLGSQYLPGHRQGPAWAAEKVEAQWRSSAGAFVGRRMSRSQDGISRSLFVHLEGSQRHKEGGIVSRWVQSR